MRNVKKWAIAASAALLLGTTGQMASALTIDQAIIAANGGVAPSDPTGYRFNDLSIADYFDRDQNATITVGDVVLGAIVLDEISQPSTAALMNVSAIYAIEVAAVNPITAEVLFQALSAGTGAALQVQYTLPANPSSFFGSAAEAIRLWQGGANTDASVEPPGNAFFDIAYRDGDLYAGFALNTYVIDFIGTNLAALAATPSTVNVGVFDADSFPGLNIVDNGLGDGGEGIGNWPVQPFLGRDVLVTGSINNTDNASSNSNFGDYVFADSAQFSLTLVPTPAAFGVGLMGLGMVFFRRPRRA